MGYLIGDGNETRFRLGRPRHGGQACIRELERSDHKLPTIRQPYLKLS